jgi:hypothetical protein
MDAGDRVLGDVTKSAWTDCIYMLRRMPAVGALGGELAAVTVYRRGLGPSSTLVPGQRRTSTSLLCQTAVSSAQRHLKVSYSFA